MNEEIEIEKLLTILFEKYGYDFRNYSPAHIKRRLLLRLKLDGLTSLSQMTDKVINDKQFTNILLKDLSINVTEMFRDPGFYQSFRKNVVELLKTWSYVKIWHAGCSTGEEVYSMAILLQEEGLYNRTLIYATDFNQQVLNDAANGIYPINKIKNYTSNYQKSGAKAEFSSYFHTQYDSVIMDKSLKNNIVWSNHNLVTDHIFSDVQLIVCRNVLIYFDRTLQEQVHAKFHKALVNGGILCLGNKESMATTTLQRQYEAIDQKQKIYKRKYSINE